MTEKDKEIIGEDDKPLHPNSKLIKDVEFGPITTIGVEGDVWATTWAGDDHTYAVFCDGSGFEMVPEEVSTGFSVIYGMPPEISGENIKASLEYKGGGPNGRKTSGILALNDGKENIIYMWIRNYNSKGGATLAWSTDFCRNWTLATWCIEELGHPSWVNAGKNYECAKDDYLYFYSPDQPNAYTASDHVILGRVHKTDARYKKSYEFFCGLDANGNPLWSTNFADRKPVLSDWGRCYRVYVDYIKGIDRYLLLTACGDGLCKEFRGSGKNLGIYEAPTPWGPWSTVYWTDHWDKRDNRFAPHVPAEWISEDGQSFYLVYSCYPQGSYKLNALKVNLKLAEKNLEL